MTSNDSSYNTTKIPDWLADNWEGVLIRIENEAFTGLNYSVPGWKCKHCGGQIGSVGLPPRVCFHCGWDSSEHSTTDVVKSSQLGFEVPEK